MRKHTKRVKLYRKKGSKKMHGGMIGGLFGFGKKRAVSPADAQAQQVAKAQDDEVASLQKMTKSKQEQASALRNQCQDYQTRADQLVQAAAEHMRDTAEIARNREAKNRCDQEHSMRLQAIDEDHKQRLAQLTQEHNAALDQEKQRAQEQHNNCLREGMGLIPRTQAMAQNPEAQAAATQLQAQFRGDRGRQLAEAERRNQAGVDPLSGRIPITRGGRKSRRRRGGTGCGTHKKKMMRAGRKSRRGGAYCYPNSGINCPYYKKYGHHKNYGYHHM